MLPRRIRRCCQCLSKSRNLLYYIKRNLVFLKPFLAGVITELAIICIFLSMFADVSIFKFRKMNYATISWKNNSYTNLLMKRTIEERLGVQQMRVLCFVMTTKQNEDTKARAVNITWGSRCNKLIFVTSYDSTLFRVYNTKIPEGRDYLAGKVFAAIEHIYKKYIRYFDFFIKADDDTYVIVENLQFLLSRFNPEEASYLGLHYKYNVHNGYMSGGGSYVMSRSALRLFVEKGLRVDKPCLQTENEDIDIGACFQKIGVAPFETHDVFGRHSFHACPLHSSVVGPLPDYLRDYPNFPLKVGPNCCSQFTISFHYIDPTSMYVTDFLLYRISIYGWDTDYDSPYMNKMFRNQISEVQHLTENEIFYAEKEQFLMWLMKFFNDFVDPVQNASKTNG